MSHHHLRGLFSEWEIAVTKKVTRQFKRRCPCLHRDDVEDLADECLSHWLTVRSKYDLQKIEYPKSFLARIVTNKLSDVVKNHLCEKREQYFQAVSLDQFLEENSDSPFLANPTQHNPSDDATYDKKKFRVHPNARIRDILKKLP